MPRRFSAPHCLLGSAILVYLTLAFSFAQVKSPWIDEGWVASAPANWAATGHFGTPSLEPTGSWLDADLKGIREYTYWNMPVGMAAQGIWYRLIGFSILKMRALGILAGLAAILAWFKIVHCLTDSIWAATITAVLLSCDYTFLWSAADGRMDMLCIALGSGGLAAYLSLRAGKLTNALYVANLLLALSVFTHPNGILFVAAFGILFLRFDSKHLRWRFLVALTPYVLLAALWGIYIWKRPDYFIAQFSANASVLGGSRWEGLAHPMEAVQLEWGRYFAHYGFLPVWVGTVPGYVASIPVVFWTALLAASVLPLVRRHSEVRLLIGITWFFLLGMTFLSIKLQNYVVFIVPLYLALLSTWTALAHDRHSRWAPLTALLAAWLIVCDGSVAWHKIRANAFANEYAPTVEYLRQHLRPGGVIFAGSYFGFSLGFPVVLDDVRLGFYSGREADYVVSDVCYAQWWKVLFGVREPAVSRYISNRLETDYHRVLVNGTFRVYARNVSGDAIPRTTGYTTLHWLTLAGQPLRQITIPGQFASPVMTPHSAGILLTKLRPGSARLWEFDFATEQLQPVASISGQVSAPTCGVTSEDCAVALQRDNRPQIFSYQWAYHWPAGQPQRLVSSEGADLPEAWSPDADWLAFTRHDAFGAQFWLYSRKTKSARLALSLDKPISEIQFSPDSRHVSFTLASAAEEEQVYTADFADRLSRLTRITSSGGHSAQWASNAELVYVQSDGTLRIGGRDIRLDGITGFTIDRERQQMIVVCNR